jgi:putative ABC transport system permease protein
MKEYEAIVNEAQTIAGASPMTMDQATVKWQSHKLEYLQVIGVNEQYALVRDAFPDVGRFFNSIDVQHGRDVCLLGYEVAERLFGVRNPLGQRVRVGRRTFEVIGVLVKRGDFFDQNLDRFVLLPITTFERAVKARHHHFTIAVKVADATRMEEAKDELRTILRRVRRVPFGKDDNFSVNEVDVLKDLYQKLTGGLYAAMFAVAGISLLVGGIGIMNIMLVSVTERTREIGVRKALGARRRWILAQFLFEAMIISMAGGTIGVLGGAGVAKLVATLSPLPAAVKSWAVLLGLGFSSGVGVFFGLFPARAAAKKDPIVALRYE